MTTENKTQVRVTRRFPFPAERVFDAWLDPKCASKWLFATPDGKMIRAEIDPRVGGRYIFTDARAGEEVEHTGEYMEIERPRRLVFTFGVPKYSNEFDRVTVEITPLGVAECELAVTTETAREFSQRSQYGWTQIVQRLAAQIGDKSAEINLQRGEFTGPGEVRLRRILPGPLERVWEYLTDSEKRGRWLASGPMELRIGGRVELFFQHCNIAPNDEPPERYREVHNKGVSMTGEVTQCEPPHLLSFTWEGDSPETNSEVVFTLKPIGDEVELVIRHHKLATDRERASVSGGWDVHTDILIALLAGSTPPPFWTAHSHLEAEYQRRLSSPKE